MTPTDQLLADLVDVLGRAARLADQLADTLAPKIGVTRVDDIPTDGSVEVRTLRTAHQYGPWVHVIGETAAVGGDQNRSLLVDGLVEPHTWHRDQCVQVRSFRAADEDLADARHRAETGGL